MARAIRHWVSLSLPCSPCPQQVTRSISETYLDLLILAGCGGRDRQKNFGAQEKKKKREAYRIGTTVKSVIKTSTTCECTLATLMEARLLS